MPHSSGFTKWSLVLILPLLFTVGCNTSSSGTPDNPAAKNPNGAGPAPVNLASPSYASVTPGDLSAAESYAILAKTGISTTGTTAITGSIGVSPVAATGITGFGLIADASNQFSTSIRVIGGGRVYAADYTPPTPSNMTSSIGSMERAYTSAAGRTLPDFTELGAGSIGGLTLTPGLYKWSSSVGIPTDVVISGTSKDVWIFQIAGNLDLSAAKSITLAGGALPKNIFWQVAGQVVIQMTASFKGIILAKTQVTMSTNSVLNGRIFSQTAVVLDAATITQP